MRQVGHALLGRAPVALAPVHHRQPRRSDRRRPSRSPRSIRCSGRPALRAVPPTGRRHSRPCRGSCWPCRRRQGRAPAGAGGPSARRRGRAIGSVVGLLLGGGQAAPAADTRRFGGRRRGHQGRRGHDGHGDQRGALRRDASHHDETPLRDSSRGLGRGAAADGRKRWLAHSARAGLDVRLLPGEAGCVPRIAGIGAAARYAARSMLRRFIVADRRRRAAGALPVRTAVRDRQPGAAAACRSPIRSSTRRSTTPPTPWIRRPRRPSNPGSMPSRTAAAPRS